MSGQVLQGSRKKAFHITIGTYPSGQLDLDQELRLLKAALLYADHVKLYSLRASMLSMVSEVGNISPEYQLKLIETVAPYLASQEQSDELSKGLQIYKRMRKKRHLGHRELIFRTQFGKVLETQWENVREVGQKMAREAGIQDLELAAELGLLELHTFSETDSESRRSEFVADCVIQASKAPLTPAHIDAMSKRDDQIIREFVEGVCNAVSNGLTYPLFDKETGFLVKEQIQRQRIDPSESAIARGKHSGLAGHLLARLPSFDQVSINEILDIRSELDEPLARFRAAVISFSEQIRSAPWDEDFSSDAEVVFHRDIRPAILDIEEAVRSNRYLVSLLRKFVDKPLVLPSGSAVGLVLSNISSLPDEIAVSVGAGLSALTVVYDAFKEWQQKNEAVERNAMYFYYRTGRYMAR